jgi:hypothetical protein
MFQTTVNPSGKSSGSSTISENHLRFCSGSQVKLFARSLFSNWASGQPLQGCWASASLLVVIRNISARFVLTDYSHTCLTF